MSFKMEHTATTQIEFSRLVHLSLAPIALLAVGAVLRHPAFCTACISCFVTPDGKGFCQPCGFAASAYWWWRLLYWWFCGL